MNNKNDLRIVTWNANGIQNRKHDLEVFLNMQNIDVCLISETHSTNHSHLKIHGYKVYQTIHPDNKARGGSAIIIKNTIKHNEELNFQTAEIQLTVVEIQSIKQKLQLGAIYCPPRYNLKKPDYLNILNHLKNRFIIGGDFNAKHLDFGSRLITTKGRELRQAIREIGGTIHSTGKPTYWPTDPAKIPDLLDFFVSKKVSANFIDLEENFDMDSDHSAVILTLSEKIVRKENKPTLVNKTTDWISFKREIEKKINLKVPLKSVQQIEEEATNFTCIIQQAAWHNTRQIVNKTAGINYPMEIRKLINEKRKARRRWNQTRHPTDKTILNNKAQQLRREIKKVKEDSISSYLSTITPYESTNYSLWKATKKIKRPITQIPTIKRKDGSWARDSKAKAETFSDHLADIFQPNDLETDIPLENHINLDREKIKLFTPDEIAEEIKTNLKAKKAPGYDLITGEVLKQLPRKGVVMLTYLFNAVLRLRHVPGAWKVAEVIMLPKPGKPPNEVKSYRPISLLPIISKILEKVILKRMKPIIENRNLIPDHQFGFRSKHATIDQVHRITDCIEKALEEKLVCSTVFLDVAQAFDKVWHEGLVHKLNTMLPRQYVELLASYVSERFFRIKHDEEYSELKEIKAGVPQGSVLGPILYLLYTSDLPHPVNVKIATFADDTALISTAKDVEDATEKLQSACNQILNWTKQWKIKLNELKSIHVNFTNKKLVDVPSVRINDVKVPYANTAKYLGMTLDVKLRWKEHIKKKKAELDITFRQLYWLIGRKSKLAIQNKVLIYNQVLKPIWLYGIQLWGCAKESNIKIIQTFQNKVLRNMVNAPWYIRNCDLHRDLRIPEVAEEIKRFATKHESRLNQHVNLEARQLLCNEDLVRRLKRIKPFELI